MASCSADADALMASSSDAEYPPPDLPALPLELFAVILADGLASRCRELSSALLAEHDASLRKASFVKSAPAAAIWSLAARCPRLQALTLNGCTAVDDQLVAHLLGALPNLARLDVSHCAQLTAPRTLRSLQDFGSKGLTWIASGTFWAPSPLLTPEHVVSNQLLALRQNDDEGMARCFTFASPANKAATGPLPRFAHMLRRGYSVMLTASVCYMGPIFVDDQAPPYAATGRCSVIYDGPNLETPVLFVFQLERQQPNEMLVPSELVGCWMTSGVGGNTRLPREALQKLLHEDEGGACPKLRQIF